MSINSLTKNDAAMFALGTVGAFGVHQLVKDQAGLNSPIIPLTNAVSITKADMVVGGLAAAGTGTAYVFKEKGIATLGAGAVLGTVISKIASAYGFNLTHAVNSGVARARALFDNAFPSQAYASGQKNQLRKMTPRDVEAQNAGRANQYLYSFTPTSNNGFYAGKEVSGAVRGTTVHANEFSYT